MCSGLNASLRCGLELYQLLRSMYCSRWHLLQVNWFLCLPEADLQSSPEIYVTIKQLQMKSIHFIVSFIFRLYCYAQKHVRSIRAVTRTGLDESQQRIPPQTRRYGYKKKFIKRSPHQLAAYNTSDRKAAVTVGVIMGVFLGESDDWQLYLSE